MTETRSNRFELPLWSSGGDSGSRADFTEAFGKLNDRAAWDDGTTQTELPITELVAGRYQLVVIGGVYRVLYRRHSGGGWDAIGGNTSPAPFHFRGLTAGVNRTDAAVTFSHPDAANVGGTIGYDGSALLTGTVRVFDDDEAGRGALLVGTDATPNLSTLGRAHVRTRAVGERALTVQAHAGDAGNLFTARTAGSADALYVDSLGRLRGTAPSSFGGAALPTLASLAVAPTASDDDDTTAGLLLHGSTGSSEITAKAILRMLRDSADAAPLAEFLRDSFRIGRLPWAGSTMTLAAVSHITRVSGSATNFWRVRRSDSTNPTTEANESLDVTLFNISANGIISELPHYVTQRHKSNLTALSVYRVTNFSPPLMELGRLVSDGMGGEVAQVASAWESDGRLRTGAWWRSTGTMRDARQSLIHYCPKIWAATGESPTSGQLVGNNSTFNYEWPVMTSRSVTTFDLDITGLIEVMFGQRTDGVGQPLTITVRTDISINGGAYTQIAAEEECPIAAPTGVRPSSSVIGIAQAVQNLASGSTFRLRTRLSVGSDGLGLYIRSIRIRAEECILESYTAA